MDVFLGRLNFNLLPRALVMGVVVFRTCLTSAENNKCVFSLSIHNYSPYFGSRSGSVRRKVC